MGVYEFREGWLHGADAGAAVNYVGERAGDSSDSGFELPAYTTVDLLARYPLASNATLGVNVNNLFDRRYYERSYNNVWVAPAAAQPDHEPDPELLSPLPPPGSHAMQDAHRCWKPSANWNARFACSPSMPASVAAATRSSGASSTV